MVTADVVRAAIRHAAETARRVEAELNAADGRLGDGDTGQTLRRLFERIEASVPANEDDLGQLFDALAKGGASATGSSLGTLIIVALRSLAKDTRGSTHLPWSETGRLLLTVRDAMLARGGASLGDKTIIDVVDAVASATTGLKSQSSIMGAARTAAVQTLDAFRSRPNRVGRARMFGEKSAGVDDPGMLALVRLFGV